jgi:hypothetical protein
MTQNQLTAVRNSEIARNNLELEKLRAKEIAETKRHAVETERENFRHNTATEALDQRRISEQHRSNVANENIGFMNALSNQSQARSAERNARSNARNADTNAANARVNLLNAGTRITELNYDLAQLYETKKHNRAVEAETIRNNDLMNSISMEKNRIARRNADIQQQLANEETARTKIQWYNAESSRINAYSTAGSSIMNGLSDLATVATAQ